MTISNAAPDVPATPTARVRAALAKERQTYGWSIREHARRLGAPWGTFSRFCAGDVPLGDGLKAAIAKLHPQLTPLLAEASLSWMHRHQATAVLPSPDQPAEAPR